MIYLGTPGRMVGLKCPSSQQVSMQNEPTLEETIEGKVGAQVSPSRPRRVWDLSLSDATGPSDHAAIMAFINGAWGKGPWAFVSSDAPVTNLLTPDQASCDPSLVAPGGDVMEGGPVLLPDGWEARSWLNAAPSTTMGFGSADIPVVSGTALTVSAWVRGEGAAVRLVWLDAAGAQILDQISVVTGTPSDWVRSFVTGLPPDGAVTAQLQAVSTSQATRPAATWTERLFDWSAGEGCQKAIIHGASKNLVLASRDFRGGRFASMQFTVTEVG